MGCGKKVGSIDTHKKYNKKRNCDPRPKLGLGLLALNQSKRQRADGEGSGRVGRGMARVRLLSSLDYDSWGGAARLYMWHAWILHAHPIKYTYLVYHNTSGILIADGGCGDGWGWPFASPPHLLPVPSHLTLLCHYHSLFILFLG